MKHISFAILLVACSNQAWSAPLVNTADSLTLVSFYQATNGPAWTNKTNWLTGNLSSWFGVTVVNGRVRGLALPNNQINGTIPDSFNNLTALENLDLSTNFNVKYPVSLNGLSGLKNLSMWQNNLTVLPALNEIASNLISLSVYNNQLEFDDLEPLMGYPISSFFYGPQNPSFFGFFSPSQILAGNPWRVGAVVGGSANVYQWLKGAVPVPGANNDTLNIPAVTALDAGAYYLRVTSPLAPALTLQNTTPYSLAVPAPGNQTYFTWPQIDAISSEIPNVSYGVSWVDIDNDGDDDLVVSNFQSVPNSPGRPFDLYENNNGTFSRIQGLPYSNDCPRNLSWADFDNDGDLDIYLGDVPFASDNKGAMYRNNGNKTFTRIEFSANSDGGIWHDYDNDGLVDLFNIDQSRNTEIYRNLGDGSLSTSPITLTNGSDWTLAFSDMDTDGDMDFVQLGRPLAIGFNNLMRADSTGVYTFLPSSPISTADFTTGARGGSWADIDNDGDMDFFGLNFSSLGTMESRFFFNDGSGNFVIQPASIVLGQALRGRSAAFGDIDNDGDLDVIINTTTTNPSIVKAFLNGGNGTFTAIPTSAQTFLTSPVGSLGQVALGDANSDGFLDLVSTSSSDTQPAALYRNVGNSNNWIKFRLQGVASNRSALGSRIRIFADGHQQIREVTAQTGLAVQSSLVQHFGLRTDSEVDSVIIHWPSGMVQRLQNVASNQMLTVVEETLAEEPGTNSSSIFFNPVFATQMSVQITPGDGDRRLVVIRPDSAVVFAPEDGAAYSPGQQLGLGQKVISASDTSILTLTGLQASKLYHFAVFEYNGLGSQANYRTPGAVASRTTLALPNVYVQTPIDHAINQNISLLITSRALTGAATYTIELNTSPVFVDTTLVQTGGKTQSFGGLRFNMTYYSRVKTNLSPDYGPTRTFSTAPAEFFSYVVSPANNSTGISLTNLARSVSLNNVVGASLYTCELNTSSNFDGVSQIKSGGRALTFTGLSTATTYYSRVKTNLSPNWGQTRQFTTATASALTYVTSPANKAVNVSYQPSVTVTNVGASSYTVQLSPTADFTASVLEQTAATRTMSFSGLAYNTVYYSRARTELDSAWGPNRSFTTTSPLAYSYVTNPANNAVNVPYVLNISANIVPAATTYTIEANTQSDFGGTSIVHSGGRTLNFALAPNQTYYVRVRTDLLPGQWGVTRSFTTISSVAYSYITSPASGATNVPYVTNVTAYNVPLATSFIIEANTLPDFTGTSIVKMGTVRTYSFTLAYDQVYYVRVQTNLAPGQWGQTRSFTTGSPQSLAYVTSPANGVVGVPTTVNVTSNLVPTATSYIIELNPDGNFAGIPIIRTGASRTKNFTGLGENRTYYSRVSTNLTPGVWGPTRSFTTVNPGGRQAGEAWVASTDEDPLVPDEITEVRVFPNPFTDQFDVHVQTTDQRPLEVQLIDITGRTVFEARDWMTNRLHTVRGEFSPGVYLLELNTEGTRRVIRVVRR